MNEDEIANEILKLIANHDPKGSGIAALFRDFTRVEWQHPSMQDDADASDYEKVFRKALIDLQYTGLVAISALDVNTVKLTSVGRRAATIGLQQWKQQEYELQRQRDEDPNRQVVSGHRTLVATWLGGLAALISLPISLAALVNSCDRPVETNVKSLQDSIRVLNARVDSLTLKTNREPARLP